MVQSSDLRLSSSPDVAAISNYGVMVTSSTRYVRSYPGRRQSIRMYYINLGTYNSSKFCLVEASSASMPGTTLIFSSGNSVHS